MLSASVASNPVPALPVSVRKSSTSKVRRAPATMAGSRPEEPFRLERAPRDGVARALSRSQILLDRVGGVLCFHRACIGGIGEGQLTHAVGHRVVGLEDEREAAVGKPSTNQSSQSARRRSSGAEKMRPTSARSSSRPPGEGSATWRTWCDTRKPGSSIHTGRPRSSGVPAAGGSAARGAAARRCARAARRAAGGGPSKIARAPMCMGSRRPSWCRNEASSALRRSRASAR